MEPHILIFGFFLLGLNEAVSSTDLKSSLTFIIDDTGSMQIDIHEVNKTVKSIFESVKSEVSHIDDFVVVTFNDPEAKLRNNAHNRSDFEDALSNIEPRGGGNCAEMSMSGMQLGLENSRPGSLLWVFTDASAADMENYYKVEELSQKMGSQVYVAITGLCDNRTDPDFLVYRDLAIATNGQVFHLRKNHIGKLFKYVELLIEDRKDIVTSKRFAAGGRNNIDVNVDDYMEELIIAVSGEDPVVTLTSPSGVMVTEDIVRLGEIAVVTAAVDPGVYKVEVVSKSETHVVISASTELHFQHGFSIFAPTNIKSTTRKPVPGKQSHLSIQLASKEEGLELRTVQILDMDDTILLEKPLILVNTQFYTTEKITPPDNMFKVAVKYYDTSSKTNLTRHGLTPIKPQNGTTGDTTPKAPTVTIEGGPNINAAYYHPLQLRCKIKGYPAPSVIWMSSDTSAALTYDKTVSIFELPDDYISVLDIPEVKNNATYTCSATNAKGIKEDTVTVQTQVIIDFNVIESPDNSTIEYLNPGRIGCKVEAFPAAKVSWYKNGEPLKPDGNLEVSEDGSMLTIRTMEPYMANDYSCLVENALVSKVFPFKLSISGLIPPTINRVNQNMTVMKNSKIDLKCLVTAGVPKPDISWLYKDVDGSEYTRLNTTADIIHFDSVNATHTGIYECLAHNMAGSDTLVIKLNVEDICNMPKDAGPCRASHTKWYYDSKLKACHRFAYGGCLGNENKFNSEADCRVACVVNNPEPETPQTTLAPTTTVTLLDKCSMPKDAGPCRASHTKWYYDSNLKACQRFQYGGCRGNENKFDSEADCRKECVVTKIIGKCEQPVDSGPCQGAFPMWYFDSGLKECREFDYGGCHGNENRFYTVEGCRTECIPTTPAPRDIDESMQSSPTVTVSQRTISIPRGGSGTVGCIAKGNPLPRVRWTKSNGELRSGISSNGNKLMIFNAREEDYGDYVCQGIVDGTVMMTDYLRVIIENVDESTPSIPTVTVSQRTISIPRGGSETVECIPKGNPLPRVRWTKSNGELRSGISSNGNTLIISDAQKEDYGDYVCQGVVDGTVMATDYLRVIVENVDESTPSIPTVTVSQRTISIPRGGSETVECIPIGNPLPRVRWTKSNGELRSGISSNGNKLMISNAREEDYGDYVCQGIVDGTVMMTDYLRVIIENVDESTPSIPTVTISQRTINIPRGGSGTVECIPKGNPLPRVRWTKSNGELRSGISSNGNNLIISDAREQDYGDFVCQGIVDGTVMATDYLRVIIKNVDESTQSIPTVTVSQRTISIPRGGSGTVGCIPKGNPLPRVRWTKSNGELRSGISSNGNNLIISDAREQDYGDFVCQGIVDGTVMATDYLRVIIKNVDESTQSIPTVTVSQRTINIPRGGSGTVECIPKGNPLPRVRWTKSNGELRSGISSNGNTLIISDAQKEDYGDYVCQGVVDGTVMATDYLRVIVENVDESTPSIPTVTVSQRTISIPRGGSETVECIPIGNPLPRVRWTKSNGELRSGISSNGNKLMISNAREEDYGDYVCQGIVDGTVMMTDYLRVIIENVDESTPSIPTVTVSQRTISIPRGGSGTVECIPKGNPLPRVRWTKSDGELRSGISSNGNNLIISDAREEDYGDYVCQGIVDGTVMMTDYLRVIIDNKCKMEKDAGPCRASHRKWYYDSHLNACREFLYGGCRGNANRFDTVEDCRAECVPTTPPPIGKCEQPLDSGPCQGAFPMWYFDNGLKECREFDYGGCHGNDNRFDTVEGCRAECDSTASDQVPPPKPIGCFLDVKWDLNGFDPLMLTINDEFPNFETSDGYLQIPVNETIKLACPVKFEKLMYKEITVTCDSEKQFVHQPYGSPYAYSDLKCTEQWQYKNVKTGRRCSNTDSELLSVGFQIVTFQEVYQVCLNRITFNPIYTKQKLIQSLPNAVSNKDTAWFDNEASTDLDVTYNCGSQNEAISRTLNKVFHDDGCCFAKRMLVNPLDVAAGLPQATTYSYLNVAPHWSNCNSQNWEEIEQRIRDLRRKSGRPLLVWTGVAQHLQIPDASSNLKNITLSQSGKEFQVPTYFWKVVQDSGSKASLAIIQVNVPDLKISDAYKYRKCPDVCRKTKWMYSGHWRDPTHGFTYCCSLEAFKSAFQMAYYGVFPTSKGLLLDVTNLPNHIV